MVQQTAFRRAARDFVTLVLFMGVGTLLVFPLVLAARSCVSTAAAQTLTGDAPLPSPSEISHFLSALLDAKRGAHWAIFAGLLLNPIVFGLRYLGAKWHPAFLTDRFGAALPFATAILGTIGTALAIGKPLSTDLFVAAVESAILAAGGYTSVRKMFFPSDTQPPPAKLASVAAPGQLQ